MQPNKKVKITNEESHVQSAYENDSCLGNWLQKYKPKEINELGVQLSKVEELKNWLLHSQYKLLLLTGPSGCGKTTTLEIVCKSLGFKLLEWITPVDKFETNDVPVLFSVVKHFEQYLIKTSRYQSLFNTNSVTTVIVVKDFPNVFLQKPSVFHALLEKVSTMCLSNPIVFICSESSICRKLFSSNLECKIPVIRFKSITNLQMLKILKAIVNKERKVNKDIEVLCDKRLGTICALSKGDIRHCVSELYFQSVKLPIERTLTPPVMPEKSKDPHIDFFLGLGKVFSPKKTQTQPNFKFTTTPEIIVEQFLGQAKVFVGRLGENFYSKFTNIYDLSYAAQRLAASDMLVARWQERDIFHEYALSVAVRGVMLTNENPQEYRFQFFGKQNTYHIESMARHAQQDGKFLFPLLYMLDSQRLHDILSFTKYLNLGNLSPPQDDYIKKITHF